MEQQYDICTKRQCDTRKIRRTHISRAKYLLPYEEISNYFIYGIKQKSAISILNRNL